MTVKLSTKDKDGNINGTATGVLQWVSHLKPKPNKFKPGTSTYSVQVESDDADLKALKQAGATKKVFVTNKGEDVLGPTGKKVINFSAQGTWPDGKPTPAPLVVDTNGKRVTVPIGNGSEGVVQFVIAQSKNATFGASTRLVAIKVTKLVPYEEKKRVEADANLLGLTEEQLEEATQSLDDELEASLPSPSILT